MAPSSTANGEDPKTWNYEYFNVTFPAEYEYVAHVEINRPEKLNAFIEIMWLNLAKIFNRLSHSPHVRAIVLTGAGDRAFCAGLDVKAASAGLLATPKPGEVEELDVARKANNMRRHILEFQACISAVEKCEKPVICVYHGIAYGLALDIGVACDIRLATPTTTLSIKEVDIGLAADIGTLTRLPKLLASSSFVKEIALTARPFSGSEALTQGLLSGVYATKRDAVAKGLEMAALIGTKSPVAVTGTKELLNWSRERSTEDGLRYTAVWNAGMVQSRDVGDAVLSGLEKRRAVFSKL